MASKTGTLVNDVKSPYSSPYVHYSAAYSSSRTDGNQKDFSVTLNFRAWLNSSASVLGTGIILRIFARLSGGEWQSVTVKQSADSWSGTAKHSAQPITLTGSSAAEKITVEFYAARADSGGNAGRLGTRAAPRKYSASLPEYSASPTGGDGSVYVRVGGVWKKAAAYVCTGSGWKSAVPYLRTGGTWKKGVI